MFLEISKGVVVQLEHVCVIQICEHPGGSLFFAKFYTTYGKVPHSYNFDSYEECFSFVKRVVGRDFPMIELKDFKECQKAT